MRGHHRGEITMGFRGMLRRVAGAGAALAAVGAMLIAPVSASAVPDDVQLQARGQIVKILHASSRKCLEANPRGEVGLAECTGLNPQKWDNFTSDGVGRYRNVAFNACLAA